MWINPLFEADTRRALIELVNAESLVTVIAEQPLRAAHVPLLVEEGGADTGGAEMGDLVLIGHIPRADPVSEAIAAGERVLCVVHGPRAYVSPDWYHDEGLPTFNYAVAHVSGIAEPLDKGALREHLLDLIRVHEERREPAQDSPGHPWAPDEAAHARIDRLLPAVLGFRIRVDEAQAKEKLGQNRSADDRRTTVEQLGQSGRDEHRAVAALMTERQGEGSDSRL